MVAATSAIAMISEAICGTRWATWTFQECGGVMPTACISAVTVCCQAGPLAPGQISTSASVAAIASTSPPPSTPRAAAHEPGGTRAGKAGRSRTSIGIVSTAMATETTSSGSTSSRLAKISGSFDTAVIITMPTPAHAPPMICITITIHRARRLWYSRPTVSSPSPVNETIDAVAGMLAVQKAISAQLRRR